MARALRAGHARRGAPSRRSTGRWSTSSIDKGQDPGTEGYSGFEATRLAGLLRERGVDHVTVVGLATDYCVKNTALDALRAGFGVTVDSTAVRGVEVRARRLRPCAGGAARRGGEHRLGPLMSATADRLLRTLARHIRDERVLEAVRAVPREAFVPPELLEDAWENVPLPIGAEQTISQPLVVARMLELLELDGSERVLDVGTGSGYHAALLARLAAHVWSIEIHPELSERAARDARPARRRERHAPRRRRRAGLARGRALRRDQRRRRGAGRDPAPLVAQLASGGRLVAPVERGDQHLVHCRRTNGDVECTRLERVRFVPLT